MLLSNTCMGTYVDVWVIEQGIVVLATMYGINIGSVRVVSVDGIW